MKKGSWIILVALLFLASTGFQANAIVYNATAGDVDYAADRDEYDISTNMDFYVFPHGASVSGAATNTLGYVEWSYDLPFSIQTANSGSMTVRAWDIDSQQGADEFIDVYFNFGLERIHAGELSGSNGGDVATWEKAVADGTTASLSGWSNSTYTFSQELLDALSGSTGFILELDIQNTSTDDWAAVIDFASITLDYDEGDPNPEFPVPEPATVLLLGFGLFGIAGFGRKKIIKRK